ncbi:MAG: HAD hydrolase-like protein [Myxococcales bacterium]|nr:HAD hydrolase-like protein [Myxococcales bacterium]
MREERRRDLVIFDFDGVLADLRLRTESTRRAVRELFASAGVDRPFRPLLRQLDEALAVVAERDSAERADELRRAVWAMIDADEERAARVAALRPGVHEALEALEERPVAIFSNNRRDVVEAVLGRHGVDPSRFVAIVGRDGAASIKPGADPILALIAAQEVLPERVYLVGDHVYDMQSACAVATHLSASEASARLGASATATPTVIGIGLHTEQARRLSLEEAGASFLARDLDEALQLICAPRFPLGLSIVLLAYNEEAAIGPAIEEARRFGRLFLESYEIVVVDDGSNDGTAEAIAAASGPDLVVLRHAANMGMGCSMRDGYAAASQPYRAHLPGDRQVRPPSLLPFLPLCRPRVVVRSHYRQPHADRLRELYSWAFRRLMALVGGLHVDFAGTYVFHLDLWRAVNPKRTGASTFVYSYELLEEFRRLGARFRAVTITPLLREAGVSKVDSTTRIVRVLRELAQSRIRRLRGALGGADG